MNAPVLELEGTWEEVAAHAPELKGQRVRLVVLPEAVSQAEKKSSLRPASGRSLLRHAGTWQGNDFEDCLQAVTASRGPVEFRE